VPFVELFRPEEGRQGITVTFIAILELLREGMIDVQQTQAYAPLHVRAVNAARTLQAVTELPAPEDGR
jgi:segregation and condensation protein A